MEEIRSQTRSYSTKQQLVGNATQMICLLKTLKLISVVQNYCGQRNPTKIITHKLK